MKYLSNAFKISVRFGHMHELTYVELRLRPSVVGPQSSLQDKFCAHSRATGNKTDGYSFTFWSKLTEALPKAK